MQEPQHLVNEGSELDIQLVRVSQLNDSVDEITDSEGMTEKAFSQGQI